MGELRQGRAACIKEAGFAAWLRTAENGVVLSSGCVGSGPGGWGGARSGQLAGLWWVGAGRELLVLVTAKTRKQKPENPWLSGVFCW